MGVERLVYLGKGAGMLLQKMSVEHSAHKLHFTFYHQGSEMKTCAGRH